MPAPIVLRREINAPPQRAFDVATDLERAPGRFSSIVRMEILTPGPVRKGTRFRETRRFKGRQAAETMEFTDFRPGRSCTVACEAHGALLSTTFDFLPAPGGATVEMRLAIQPRSITTRLMAPFIAGAMRRLMATDLEDLRIAAESPDPPPPATGSAAASREGTA